MKKSYYKCLVLVILIFACTNEEITKTEEESYKPNILNNSGLRQANNGSFVGPLFDLETAPNGEILVADAGSGIVNSSGVTEVSLPGVNNIASIGRGSMWAITGPPDAAINVGQGLYRMSKGNTEFIADLYQFDEVNNPDGGEIGSNPYSVISINGNTAIVADAGANDLLKVNKHGSVELVAVFPSELVSTSNAQSLVGCPSPAPLCNLPSMIPAESVPTAVAVGPDGYYYVGELKGFPAPTNQSSIWKVAPDASGAMCGSDPNCIKAFNGGFTSIIDMVFGNDGKLYVAELDAKSWLALELGVGEGGVIKACNTETMECEIIATGIPMLTAIEFDKNGSLWAIRNALIPGAAEVFKVMD